FALKVVILLTDGRANQPWRNAAGAALGQAQLAVDNGIIIYTVGVGEYLDSSLLVDMADLSGGDSHFTTDPLGPATQPDAQPGWTNLDYIFAYIAKRIPYRLTM
ncbi:MAG: VWA domain-containing protein, partial [Nitrospinota bacterium]